MTRSHIGPAKLAIKTTINGNSILVGNGSFRFRIYSTGKRRSVSVSVSVSTSAKEFPFSFPFRKNSVSIFIFSFRFHFSAKKSESFRSTFIPNIVSTFAQMNTWMLGNSLDNYDGLSTIITGSSKSLCFHLTYV
jgi:hypothetical protein